MDDATPPSTLFGRDQELRRIETFLEEARRRGSSLFLYGEPGVGKTRLLDAAVERADAQDVRVIRATGVQYMADVSYALLGEVLLPLASGITELDTVFRDALQAALGMRTGPVPPRLVILNACLTLLRRQAEERPLLLVVDDLPWADGPSAVALGFVARRLTGSRVGLITATRNDERDHFERSGLPTLQVRPIDERSSDELLRAAFPRLAPGVRHRLVAEARGNPLALLELPAALGPDQLSGVAVLPDVLPLTRHVESVFAARVALLPALTQEALLILAQEGTGDLRVLQRAAGAEPALEHLAPAESAKLIKVDLASRQVEFRHPLVRSAVVESAGEADLRRIHRLLAGLFTDDPERRALHLAEAASGADESIASPLEQAARRKLRRGDATGALAALVRAARFSTAADDRCRRLAHASYLAAHLTGELGTAARLLAEIRAVGPRSGGSLHAAAAAAYVLIDSDGDVETAHAMLVDAVENGDHGYEAARPDLVEALHALLMMCWFAGREDFWPPLYAAIDRLRPQPPELLLLMSRALPDAARTTPGERRRLTELIDRRQEWREPHQLVRLHASAIYLDLFGGCRAQAWGLVENGRAGGAVRSALSALLHLGLDDFAAGRWEEAERLADEGLALCEGHGYTFVAWFFHLHKALLAAARGDAEVDRWADELTRVTTARRAHGAAGTAHHPRALAAAGRGDWESVYQHASRLSPAGSLAPYTSHALWVALDLVEAALRTGRTAEAEAHTRAMRESGLPDLSPRLALLTLAAEALVAPDEEALALFERAVSAPGAQHWPFDYARVQFLYGERLRRVGDVAEARSHLITALTVFQRLQAAPWANRAGAELRAAGRNRPLPVAGGTGTGSLTAQEVEIAMLAAEGLTNKQIGERLFLSHRTVGTHLYRIFPKLGITSRAALRDALSQ
ncbi:LuxR family transcriptional regulator [Streptomyces hygroscopicus subsp. hygroscopicus]|nr:LuxR family transcriptional regulator [Streptomyces hygroscopicus]GLX49098.1 LuxR family transcriptional regulator [Streptomyces hygroscopicus subsp. hygroscopicus]